MRTRSKWSLGADTNASLVLGMPAAQPSNLCTITYDENTPPDWPPAYGGGGHHDARTSLTWAHLAQSSEPLDSDDFEDGEDPTQVFLPQYVQPKPRQASSSESRANPQQPAIVPRMPHLPPVTPTMRLHVGQVAAALAPAPSNTPSTRPPQPPPQQAAPTIPPLPPSWSPQALPQPQATAPRPQPAAPPRQSVPARPAASPQVSRSRDYDEDTFPTGASERPWLGALMKSLTAVTLVGAGFFLRGFVEGARHPELAAVTPPPCVSAAPISAAEPAAAVAAPALAAAEPVAVATPVPPPSAAADARLTAKQRRSAERAERIRERWLANHPPKHGAAASLSASDDDSDAEETPVASHHASRKAAAEPDDDSSPSDDSSKTGRLRLNSRPWSQVYVDGKQVGHTPLLGLELPAGKHTVRMVNEPMDLTKTFAVKIKAGDTVTRLENLSE
ncbi:MAG: hypothetical protein RL701_4388 [Pseudomonadota bacterium]